MFVLEDESVGLNAAALLQVNWKNSYEDRMNLKNPDVFSREYHQYMSIDNRGDPVIIVPPVEYEECPKIYEYSMDFEAAFGYYTDMANTGFIGTDEVSVDFETMMTSSGSFKQTSNFTHMEGRDFKVSSVVESSALQMLDARVVLVNPTQGTITRAKKAGKHFDFLFVGNKTNEALSRARMLEESYRGIEMTDYVASRPHYFGFWSALAKDAPVHFKCGFALSKDILLTYSRSVMTLNDDNTYTVKFKDYLLNCYDYCNEPGYRCEKYVTTTPYSAMAQALYWYTNVDKYRLFSFKRRFLSSGYMIDTAAFLRDKWYIKGKLQSHFFPGLGRCYILDRFNPIPVDIKDTCLFRSRMEKLRDFHKHLGYQLSSYGIIPKYDEYPVIGGATGWQPVSYEMPDLVTVAFNSYNNYLFIRRHEYIYIRMDPSYDNAVLERVDDYSELWVRTTHVGDVERVSKFKRPRASEHYGTWISGGVFGFSFSYDGSGDVVYDITDSEFNGAQTFECEGKRYSLGFPPQGIYEMMKQVGAFVVSDKDRMELPPQQYPWYADAPYQQAVAPYVRGCG